MTPISPQTVEPVTAPCSVLPSTPEFDVLLACCRAPTHDLAEHQRAWLREVDGGRLVQLAEHHGIVPRVYPCLAASDLLARETREALRHRYEANARRALALTQELFRVLELLESHGIAALPYKGPVLADQLYGDVAQRQFSDLDVLVQPADVPRVKSALCELGYQPGIQLTKHQERAFLASGYEYTFDWAGQPNLLEIQWQVLPRFYAIDFDISELFRRAVPAQLAGRTVRTVCPEDLLVVLSVHAAKHAWMRLSWLCDIARLGRSPAIDKEAVKSQARRLGVERIMATTFAAADALLNSKLTVERGFGGEPCRAIWEEIIPTMAKGAEYNVESVSYFRLMLRMRERWQDRMRFLWRLAITPSVGEWSVVRLPGPLFFLYRAVRVLRLGVRLIR
ncbi:MAG TPA: nucleotidyltransferase family protein [Terriglobales bacterium]|jgi:hypothetical protein|nr:nucleotidyltransferase family protein [Terriglobales bacterium]